MSDLLLAVFLGYPVQDPSAAVIVEIDVDIGQRNTVGIQETLEQQVVGYGVDLRDAETVCHSRAGRRASSRAHRDIQFVAGGIDEVLHDEEVTRETHRLHYVQLEYQPFADLVGERVAVTALGTVEGQFGQVVGLELDTVELVVTAEFFDLFVGFLFAHDHIPVLVTRELVEEFALGDPLPVLLLGAELLRNGECRHDGGVVDRIALDLVAYVDRRGHRFGHIPENRGHLGPRLEPLLLRVEHSLGVVKLLFCAEADQTVVSFGILLVHEVHVIGAY